MATSVDNTKSGKGGAVSYATAADVDAGTSDQLSVTPKALSESDLILNKEAVANKDASGGYVGKTLEKINFWNSTRTFLSFFTNANTAARTYTFPDRDGTIADDTDLALKEDVANKSTDTALGTSDTAYPSQRAVKTYVDNSVAGLLNDRGNHDASGNTFPTTGGSGSGGAVKKGDTWYVSVAGTLGGVAVNVGDTFRAKTDAPGQTASNWAVLEGNIGYVPERSIDAASAKTTAVDADAFGIIDSDAGNVLKKISWANLKAAIWSALGSLIAAGTSKATPVDADGFAISDSAASGATKFLSWANLKTTLKAYFDTLYAAAGSGSGWTLHQRITIDASFNSSNVPNIASTVNEIAIQFEFASLTTSALFVIQLGRVEGMENTGYTGGYSGLSSAAQAVTTQAAGIYMYGGAGASSVSGKITLQRANTNRWTWVGMGYSQNLGQMFNTAGDKELAGALTQFQIALSAAGAGDGGAISIWTRP